MADVKWIKLATNIFDNRKVRQIETLPDGNAVIVVWLKLLCLAGSINDSGMVYFTKEIPYTEQMMAAQFNMPLTTVQLAVRTFEQFGMIEIEDDILHIANWEKYQSTDRLNELREYNRLAQQKSRAKRKALQAVNDMSMTSQRCHDTDKEEDKEEDKKKNIKKRYARKPFIPPTLEEVQEYCNSRGNMVDAKQFYDYYSAGDWIDNKGNEVKSWKQKVITWENNRKDNQQRTVGANGIAVTNEKSDLDGVF